MLITTWLGGTFVEVNQTFLDMVGYNRSDIIGHNAIELNLWHDSKERDAYIRQLKQKGSLRSAKARVFQTKSGEPRSFLLSSEIIQLNGVSHVLWIIKDITEHKRFEEDLHISDDKFAKAFNASPITMSITTLDEGRIIAVNDSFCRILGYSREEILERTSLEIGFWLDSSDRHRVREAIERNQSIRDLEVTFGNKNREQRLGLYSAEGIDIDGERCILSLVTDITENRQAEEEIAFLSYHDKLTGLYNRPYFENQWRNIGSHLPVSLIMADINGLKLINDALGHQEGDRLLVAVADIFRKVAGKKDIVARWGSDEFVVLLPGAGPEAASKKMDKIKTLCKQLNIVPVPISISLGRATCLEAVLDMGQAIKEAEDKMHRNKLLEGRSNRSSFLIALERTLWTRSHETEAHCKRMQKMALMMGKYIKLPDCELDNLKLLAALHDIGKIAVPNNILDKPGKLSAEEWETIKKHPEIGYRIAVSSPDMAPIAEAILHHHERWDGSGYPLGIKGAEIPLLSRILAIADAYDAMTNGRPYQPTSTPQEAWNEIQRCAGSQFDPKLVKRSVKLFSESDFSYANNLE